MDNRGTTGDYRDGGRDGGDCLQREAVIAETQGIRARVETQRAAACGACTARMACGVSVLERTRGTATLWADNPEGAKEGERVMVEIDSGALLSGAMLVYLLPLAALIGAALVADLLLAAPPWGSATAAAVGLLFGLLAARQVLQRRRGAATRVRIRRQLPDQD
nr:SoxR reducing system RseC family protein [Halorhodospira abdelmalekii]